MEREKEVKLIKRYSEALKLKVVSDIESGRLTMAEASRYYGMTKGSALNWVKKYGQIGRKTRIITMVPKDEQERIKELESALADAHLRARLYETMLKQASEHYGEDLKKNFGTAASESLKSEKGKK